MSDERADLLEKLAALDEAALSKEARQLKARLYEIQVEAAKIAAAAENDGPEIKLANLAEEAVQLGLRLAEIVKAD